MAVSPLASQRLPPAGPKQPPQKPGHQNGNPGHRRGAGGHPGRGVLGSLPESCAGRPGGARRPARTSRRSKPGGRPTCGRTARRAPRRRPEHLAGRQVFVQVGRRPRRGSPGDRTPVEYAFLRELPPGGWSPAGCSCRLCCTPSDSRSRGAREAGWVPRRGPQRAPALGPTRGPLRAHPVRPCPPALRGRRIRGAPRSTGLRCAGGEEATCIDTGPDAAGSNRHLERLGPFQSAAPILAAPGGRVRRWSLREAPAGWPSDRHKGPVCQRCATRGHCLPCRGAPWSRASTVGVPLEVRSLALDGMRIDEMVREAGGRGTALKLEIGDTVCPMRAGVEDEACGGASKGSAGNEGAGACSPRRGGPAGPLQRPASGLCRDLPCPPARRTRGAARKPERERQSRQPSVAQV